MIEKLISGGQTTGKTNHSPRSPWGTGGEKSPAGI